MTQNTEPADRSPKEIHDDPAPFGSHLAPANEAAPAERVIHMEKSASATRCGLATYYGNESGLTMSDTTVDPAKVTCPACKPRKYWQGGPAAEPTPAAAAEATATLAATGLARPPELTGRVSGVTIVPGEADQPSAHAKFTELPQADPQRTAYIIGLRKLADVLEANPAVPLPAGSGTDGGVPVLFGFYGSGSRDELAAAVRAFPITFSKDADSKWLNLNGRLAGLHVQLYASRDQVCTRRVVGTEEREVEVEVTPAVKEKRTETVEVVEWDCHPILSDGKPDGAR